MDVSARQSPVLHLDGFALQEPELHLAVSGQQEPVLHLDYTEFFAALEPVYTLRPKLQQDMSALQSIVLLLDQSTHWGLGFSRTCLHYGVLCCS
jgi:hypothetical protein